jgi:MoaA/NifB/PqqE/SkfB family radical SAM enzyme
MRLIDYLTKILPKSPYYAAVRRGWVPPVNPLTLTFSVTAACQSRCKTCHIGTRYLADPKIAAQNLCLDVIERVFRSLGPIYFFNVSGGEPFMRPDLAEIIRSACIHLKPHLIHIPTNAALPERVDTGVRKILSIMDRYAPPATPITIKPSIDGIGAVHDRIRGLKGNFRQLEQTIDLLLEIRHKNPRLHVDLGTVISNYNIEYLDEIEDWVHARGIESYRHEIAGQRVEFHNLGEPVAPPIDIYEMLVSRFKKKILSNMDGKATLTRITEAVRLVYYDVAVQILKQGQQITPCYGGISNIHINYDGEIWPCCVLGGKQAMGNIRHWNYDVKKLLCSTQAIEARRYIANGNCACPLANQWLNNILLTPRHMLKVLITLVKIQRGPGKDRRQKV